MKIQFLLGMKQKRAVFAGHIYLAQQWMFAARKDFEGKLWRTRAGWSRA